MLSTRNTKNAGKSFLGKSSSNAQPVMRLSLEWHQWHINQRIGDLKSFSFLFPFQKSDKTRPDRSLSTPASPQTPHPRVLLLLVLPPCWGHESLSGRRVKPSHFLGAFNFSTITRVREASLPTYSSGCRRVGSEDGLISCDPEELSLTEKHKRYIL